MDKIYLSTRSLPLIVSVLWRADQVRLARDVFRDAICVIESDRVTDEHERGGVARMVRLFVPALCCAPQNWGK